MYTCETIVAHGRSKLALSAKTVGFTQVTAFAAFVDPKRHAEIAR